MWKDKIDLFAVSLFLVLICFSRGLCLNFVGFAPLAQSDTLYKFQVLTCDAWVDGRPTLLFRSIGCPDPKQLNFVFGYSYLYTADLKSSTVETRFAVADSLDSKSIIAGDFDSDGSVEIMGISTSYFGDGTEIETMKYRAGSWITYKQIIPYYIERLIRVKLYNTTGDDFIFLFNALDLSQADSTAPEIETPPLGLIYGNWANQRLNLFPDSTIHNAIEAIGSKRGDTTFVYIYEGVVDSTQSTPDGFRGFGALVKYRFNRGLSKLERLYYAESPSGTNEIVSDPSSSLYASDSLIQIMRDDQMQWYIDNGDSLTLSLFQWTPFECVDPVLIDIDNDGKDELVCSEAIVKDQAVQVPNWVIKAYKILE